MIRFTREYFVVSISVIMSILMFSPQLYTSQPFPNEPSALISSSDSSRDDTNSINFAGISIPMPGFGSLFIGDNSLSDDQKDEEELLSETVLSIAVPKHLIGKMDKLKPFIKYVIRAKKNSPKEEEKNVFNVLKHAVSPKKIVSSQAAMPAHPSDDDVPGSALCNNLDYQPLSETSSLEIQRERIKIQHLLLEASQTALESKESELQHRTKLLEIKEKKLEERFSKKATACIAGSVSVLTTLAGTLTAYYSSQK